MSLSVIVYRLAWARPRDPQTHGLFIFMQMLATKVFEDRNHSRDHKKGEPQHEPFVGVSVGGHRMLIVQEKVIRRSMGLRIPRPRGRRDPQLVRLA